jgi:hypothetical protein
MFDENTINLDEARLGNKKTTVDLPLPIWTQAKQNLIEFREALIFGIKFKLAEKDSGLTFEYPHNGLSLKIQSLAKKIQELYARIEELEAKTGEAKNE